MQTKYTINIDKIVSSSELYSKLFVNYVSRQTYRWEYNRILFITTYSYCATPNSKVQSCIRISNIWKIFQFFYGFCNNVSMLHWCQRNIRVNHVCYIFCPSSGSIENNICFYNSIWRLYAINLFIIPNSFLCEYLCNRTVFDNLHRNFNSFNFLVHSYL